MGVLLTRVSHVPDPGLSMTVRMGPSHFTIRVSVPSFSEDQRNRNSRYEIQGLVSESCYLATSTLFSQYVK